ncbi:phosphatidylglycerol lysyltransferase domain-containing protein [Paenibacillus thermotolerans]|uniref:phosphatidylglycerol lysyltransferase domain-containing protein n=1 Tax=Paenibacillus thermotolerans TaxID=3027807 RepID=UPI002367758C|nr:MULTISPECIES: phosphatidylglycerol lysyltransferase domain-containing protein [unclassified Paenibacillus]
MNESKAVSPPIQLKDWTFHRLALSDKEMYLKYVAETEYPMNYSKSFFDFVWGRSRVGDLALWKEIDGMLTIFKYERRKNVLYLPFLPLGKGSPEHVIQVLIKALTFCSAWNGKKAMVRVLNNMQLDYLRSSPLYRKYFRSITLVGREIYVSVQHLVHLTGTPFASIRKTINRFMREYPNAVIRKAVKGDEERLWALKQIWNQTAGAKYPKILDDEYYRRIINRFDELNHIVLLIEVDSKVIAMISGAINPDGLGWANLLKYDNSYKGVSTVMYIELANEIHRLNPESELINLGSDIGVGDGLSLYKNKLRPVLFTDRLRLFLK